MNILLVYPAYPETFWSFKQVLRFVRKKATYPPLGLLTVASMLPQEWNKRLVDLNVSELRDEHIAWADMVFISAMIVQKPSAREVVMRCKEHGRTVVAGGPAFTTMIERFEGVDHFVLNEAEVTLPMFLEDLKNGCPKHVYASWVRPDITKTPLPMWSLINFKDYVTMPVQYSRGCPFDCDFCDIVIMNGHIPRVKAPEQMIAEFQALYNAGWRGSVFVVDDNFIGNKANVKGMLPALIEWQKRHRYPFSLLTEASVNLADDHELMGMMSEANFHKVFLGIETPCTESLTECGKLQNTKRDLAETVRIIHRHGMQVMAGFIVGFDSDTESIFETQIRFIQKVGVVTAMVGLLNVLPRTRLWRRLKSEGRLLGETTGENTDGSLNFIPRMDREKLIAGYKQIISRIYSPKNYYKRIHTFIRHYKPTVRARLSWPAFNAFLMSLWEIGILSRSRFLYWRLLIRTFFTKIKAFPVAVELAIYGEHFQRFARRVSRHDEHKNSPVRRPALWQTG